MIVAIKIKRLLLLGRKTMTNLDSILKSRGITLPTKVRLVTVKNPPAMQETWVQSLGWEDALEEGTATHSSMLAWRIPTDRGAWWTTVHGVAKSWTRLTDWTELNWTESSRRNMSLLAGDIRDVDLIPGLGRSPGGGHSNPLQHSWLENPHGQRSLAGYSPCGNKESDTTKHSTTVLQLISF